MQLYNFKVKNPYWIFWANVSSFICSKNGIKLVPPVPLIISIDLVVVVMISLFTDLVVVIMISLLTAVISLLPTKSK